MYIFTITLLPQPPQNATQLYVCTSMLYFTCKQLSHACDTPTAITIKNNNVIETSRRRFRLYYTHPSLRIAQHTMRFKYMIHINTVIIVHKVLVFGFLHFRLSFRRNAFFSSRPIATIGVGAARTASRPYNPRHRCNAIITDKHTVNSGSTVLEKIQKIQQRVHNQQDYNFFPNFFVPIYRSIFF